MEYQTLIETIEDLKKAGLIYNDTDFCRKTGMAKSFLSEMKAGRRPITEQTVQRIRDTFPTFFNEGGEEPPTDVAQLLSIMEGDRELIREMARRKDEEIDRLLSIVEAVTGVQKKPAAAAS